MKRELRCLATVVSVLFLSSCAVPAAVVGIGGTIYGTYKEAKAHYPNKLSYLPDIPDFIKSSKSENIPKSPADEDHLFGFDCTKQKNNKSQTECFNRFTKSLSEKKQNRNMHRQRMTKEEELSFFDDSKADLNLKKPKVIKAINKKPTAQHLQTNHAKSNIKNHSSKVSPMVSKANKSPEILDTYLLNWVKAWQKRDVNSYISFYSKDFSGTKRSRLKWEAFRRHALKNNYNISIEVSDVKIYQSHGLVEVNFTQRFKSNSFSDVGIKELIWKKIGGDWKILKETWIPS